MKRALSWSRWPPHFSNLYSFIQFYTILYNSIQFYTVLYSCSNFYFYSFSNFYNSSNPLFNSYNSHNSYNSSNLILTNSYPFLAILYNYFFTTRWFYFSSKLSDFKWRLLNIYIIYIEQCLSNFRQFATSKII